MLRALAIVVGVVLVALPAAGGAVGDYAAVALNILPPGQSGSLLFPPTASDQLKLYDGLTPLRGNVRAADLTRSFKPERFGVSGKVVRTERPRPGLRILRDRWDVPHVYGRTRADVEFGAGYVTAEDRYVLLQLLRGPGRLAALDAPGVDPFALATSGRQFSSTPAAEERIAQELSVIRAAGPKGRQLLADVRSYVAGINAYYRKLNVGLRPWTTNDVIAVGSMLGASLGVGGGDETRRSMFFDALRRRFGAAAPRYWDLLAEQQDPEAPARSPTTRSQRPARRTSSSTPAASNRGASPTSSPSSSTIRSPRATRSSFRPAGPRPAIPCSSPVRRSATPTRRFCSSSICTAAASTHAVLPSRGSRSTFCSAAGRILRAAQRRRTRTSSITTWRPCAATTSTISTRAPAGR